MVTPEVSKYMRQLSLKRKNKRGGFNSVEVQDRIKKIKADKKKKSEADKNTEGQG